jgi:SPP1 gp7 family putative phage head morphogenesis protein
VSDRFDDALFRYTAIRRRAEAGINRALLRELSALRDEIKGLLGKVGPFDGPLKAARLRQVVTELDRLVENAGTSLRDSLEAKLTELGQTDSEILAERLSVATDRPLDGPSVAAIAGVAGGFALALSQTLARFRATLTGRLIQETPPTIDGAIQFVNDAMQAPSVDLDRLAETAQVRMLNEVLANLYREGQLTTWRWTALTDSSTCLICAVKDGTLLGPDDPRPPLAAHPRCRCTIVPVVPEDEPGSQSPANYEQWLERQPEAVQRAILGPTRYRLFLADRKKSGFQQGGLPLWEGVEDNRIIPVARLKTNWAALLALQISSR